MCYGIPTLFQCYHCLDHPQKARIHLIEVIGVLQRSLGLILDQIADKCRLANDGNDLITTKSTHSDSTQGASMITEPQTTYVHIQASSFSPSDY